MKDFKFKVEKVEQFYRDVNWVALSEYDDRESFERTEWQEMIENDNRERAQDMMKELT